MKHAVLLQLLRQTARGPALCVVDTHAGAGIYDLQSDATRRSGEAEAGVKRLLALPTPEVFKPLIASVRQANRGGPIRWYPGSPSLVVSSLRSGDSYVGCELVAEDCQRVRDHIAPIAVHGQIMASMTVGDGYQRAEIEMAADQPTLIFIDPPFERGDEYDRILRAVTRAARSRMTSLAIWAPLKDLETFDALLRGLERLQHVSVMVAEVRLRPLSDPMRMNGCAMVLINCPDIAERAEQICRWTAANLGDAGAQGRVFHLGERCA